MILTEKMAYITYISHFFMEKSKDTKIFMLCYEKKEFDLLDDAVVTPLQVGAARSGLDICELKDNTGDNISEKNYFYIENTGIYWIWKNIKDAKYKGQMQYRRRLDGIDENFDFDKIFDEYEVIAMEPYNYPANSKPKFAGDMYIPAKTVEAGYKFSNSGYDIQRLEVIIKQLHPEYTKSYDKYIKNGEDLYYSNGFVMKTEDYDNYCEFLFKVLGEFETNFGIVDERALWFHVGRDLGNGGFSQEKLGSNVMSIAPKNMWWQMAIGGFLSERIFTLWLLHHFKKDEIFITPYKKMENGMWI